MLTAQSTDEEIWQVLEPTVKPPIIASVREHLTNGTDPLALDPSSVPEYVAPADPMAPGEAQADVDKLNQEMTIEKAALIFAQTALPLILKAAGGL